MLYHRHGRNRALAASFPAGQLWTPPHNVIERWALALEIGRFRPDVLHSPDHVCPQPLGWHTVLTVHDLAFRMLPDSHTPTSRAYYAGLDRSVHQATRIICVSEATRRDLLAATGCLPANVRVVYEAPDPIYAQGGPAMADDRPYFVFVGPADSRKNLPAVLRALARLPQDVRPLLHVVGSPGPATSGAVRLAGELAVECQVRWRGWLPTPEIAALYRGAVALVYPSLLEGFGLPILEAMAAGAPVITSDRSSMPEVAGDAAVLVDPTDVDALAGAMARLLGDREWRETLRCRGTARAAQFTWQRAAEQTLEILVEAANA
jgi:glycosyltransferase involved in cell wall biosynthesis